MTNYEICRQHFLESYLGSIIIIFLETCVLFCSNKLFFLPYPKDKLDVFACKPSPLQVHHTGLKCVLLVSILVSETHTPWHVLQIRELKLTL